ncbi:helix-turn-helix domain-containing protein [Deinococcus aerolatus]
MRWDLEAEHLEQGESRASLGRDFGLSRETVYQYL